MKKVKAIDIAKELGISKSTVSLALNNKPGVKEETRKEILEYKERMEKQSGRGTIIQGNGKTIKLIFVRREDVYIEWGGNLDFPGKVMAAFDAEAKKDGFLLGVSYMILNENEVRQTMEECMHPDVAGIVILGTELQLKDKKYFEGVQKPMVIYDMDFENGRNHSVVPDNRRGVKIAMQYLYEQGMKRIVYLTNKSDIYIYNLSERRKAVLEFFFEKNINPFAEDQILEIGTSTENVYRNMLVYLKKHELPDAFLCESCQITLGVIRAFREQHIRIPEDVSLVGIDEVPDFYSDGIKITAVRIPHEERAKMAMQLLKMEMCEESAIKSRVLTACMLVKGNSVKRFV